MAASFSFHVDIQIESPKPYSVFCWQKFFFLKASLSFVVFVVFMTTFNYHFFGGVITHRVVSFNSQVSTFITISGISQRSRLLLVPGRIHLQFGTQTACQMPSALWLNLKF